MVVKTFDLLFAVATLLFALLMLSIVLAAQDDEPPLDPRIAAYDRGPSRIDVSNYPEAMRDAYRLFSVKCGKCHTLARPINADFVLEEEWERYIKRMMNKAGTFISPTEGKTIYDFLVYDSQTRKRDAYDRRKNEIGGE